MNPEIQIVITLIGFAITVYGFYNVLKTKSIEQATKINTLELKVSFLEQTVSNNIRRLDDHDKQNQALVQMTEQIKNLTEDVRELKVMFKERG